MVEYIPVIFSQCAAANYIYVGDLVKIWLSNMLEEKTKMGYFPISNTN